MGKGTKQGCRRISVNRFYTCAPRVLNHACCLLERVSACIHACKCMHFYMHSCIQPHACKPSTKQTGFCFSFTKPASFDFIWFSGFVVAAGEFYVP